MIIGAGIVAVYYIEPYPKSLVDQLYGDLIDTSPRVESQGSFDGRRVPFHQFVGIAPRHYSRAFTAGERRSGHQLVEYDRLEACPRPSGWSEVGVEERQATAAASIAKVVEALAQDGQQQQLDGMSQPDLASDRAV